MSYHHYSPAPLGGLWATEEGTCDARESEATRTQVQMISLELWFLHVCVRYLPIT
jgi:hypothetical protein